MACSEAVDLPCTVHLDPQGPYRVFWVKVSTAMPAVEGLAAGTTSLGLATLCSPGPASESLVFPHASLTLLFPLPHASRNHAIRFH